MAIDKELFDITHEALVKRGAKWLQGNHYTPMKYPIVIAELVTANMEIPDIIGFKDVNSILIECKVSRSDFIADKKKPHRNGIHGMGDYRYYLAPKGLIKPDELPQGWGLLEATQHHIRINTEADRQTEVDKQSEIVMLMSVIRRLRMSTCVFVEADEESE